jgi:chorismate mutase
LLIALETVRPEIDSRELLGALAERLGLDRG